MSIIDSACKTLFEYIFRIFLSVKYIILESEDLGDLLLAKDFYLLRFKLSSFKLRLSYYLNDFFLGFFDTTI